MGKKGNISVTNAALIVMGIIIIILTILLLIVTSKLKTKTETLKESAISQNQEIINNNNKVKKDSISTCEINLEKAKTNDVITKKLNDNIVLGVTIKNKDEVNPMKWSISVNNKKDIFDDGTPADIESLKIYYSNNYIFYETNDGTDIRCVELIIIDKDGNIVKNIYDLDKNDIGMVPYEFEYGIDYIKIKGTRWYHGYDICTKIDGNSLAWIPVETALEKKYKTLVTKADYIYKMDEKGEFDFNNPEVIEIETFGKFVQNNKEELLKFFKHDESKQELVNNF